MAVLTAAARSSVRALAVAPPPFSQPTKHLRVEIETKQKERFVVEFIPSESIHHCLTCIHTPKELSLNLLEIKYQVSSIIAVYPRALPEFVEIKCQVSVSLLCTSELPLMLLKIKYEVSVSLLCI